MKKIANFIKNAFQDSKGKTINIGDWLILTKGKKPVKIKIMNINNDKFKFKEERNNEIWSANINQYKGYLTKL